MREFPIIDSATSVDQLRMRLQESELEDYGDAFIPEFVYDVIRRLPRFSTMRVSSLFTGLIIYLQLLSVVISRMRRSFLDFFWRECMRSVLKP